jgi:hypothetical protein
LLRFPRYAHARSRSTFTTVLPGDCLYLPQVRVRVTYLPQVRARVTYLPQVRVKLTLTLRLT